MEEINQLIENIEIIKTQLIKYQQEKKKNLLIMKQLKKMNYFYKQKIFWIENQLKKKELIK